MNIGKYAKNQGYDSVKNRGKWNGFDIYEPLFDKGGAVVGCPQFILVKGEKIRMSTIDEAFKILDSFES